MNNDSGADMSNEDWFDEDEGAEDAGQIDEYDITSAPNDFNLLTLVSFVESGAVKIPGFQRNYVWDKIRASKLMESLIIGIPVPQLFLYEESKNKFLVIDGQQRLMSIYYFFKQRFPRKDKRTELRQIFDLHGRVPEEILQNDDYFEKFNLYLSSNLPGSKNKFHGLNYQTLGDYKVQLDLRPLRNIVVRQNSPSDDDSSVYEVFNRLNTGSVNLRPQEIRSSMYHSEFYEKLSMMNMRKEWRKILNKDQPDLHMKDVEILLRAFAMLISGEKYAPSLVRFLNSFSRSSKLNTREKNEYLVGLFSSFLDAASKLPSKAFINPRNDRFNVVLFESVFSTVCADAFKEGRTVRGTINPEAVENLANNGDFIAASIEGTTRTDNVKTRRRLAKEILEAL